MSGTAPGARPRRILMVAATPYFADRGCHVRIQGEARALERAGLEVAIATYGLGRDVPGGRIHRTAGLPGYHRLDAAPSLGKLPLDALLLARTLSLAIDERPDLLHGHTQEGGLIALLVGRTLGLPVLVDLQSRRVAEELEHYGTSGAGGALFRIADRFDRWIPAAADAVVASSPAIVDWVREEARGRGPVALLPDAIDVPERPAAPEPELYRRLELDPGRPVVAYLGLLTQAQGLDLLLAAAGELRGRRPGVQWLIMGYPDAEAWRGRAEALGLGEAMRFTGRIAFEEAPRHLALADLAVSPKRGATEGNGKLLLYMSLGLPALALETPSNRAVLGPDGLYAADDAGAWAAAIDRALAAPGERAERGEKLRERARREASWEARAGTLREIYERVLA